MSFYSNLLRLLPLTVNSSGTKHRMLIAAGKMLTAKSDNATKYYTQFIQITKHPCAEIIRYAPYNFFRDFHRAALGRYMQSHLKPGQLFIDIGANLGGYSMLAGELGCTVYNAEPEPSLSAFLKENEHCFGNHLTVALSDEEGTSEFFIADKNLEGNSLVASNKGWQHSGYSHSVQVRTASFDQVLLPKVVKYNTPAFVKIDVEGNEEKVLRGMTQALQSDLIKNIWCEVRGPQSDRNANSYKAVCSLAEANGYKSFVVDAYGHAQCFEEQKHVRQFFDLLFVKD
ncbi:MAG: FkbM family methyltransferase [Flavobacteriales bacterium]